MHIGLKSLVGRESLSYEILKYDKVALLNASERQGAFQDRGEGPGPSH